MGFPVVKLRCETPKPNRLYVKFYSTYDSATLEKNSVYFVTFELVTLASEIIIKDGLLCYKRKSRNDWIQKKKTRWTARQKK